MSVITDDPDYQQTAALDELRHREYARLDATGQVYLDYTGAGLHAESQIREHLARITGVVLGNPHSVSLASAASTDLVERARRAVLRFFNADPAEYTAIFTANCSGALKLVGESFPFDAGSRFLLTTDNHNSVNGVREFAHAAGAAVDYVPLTTPDLRIDLAALERQLGTSDRQQQKLFAYPAQSNFSGVKHPLSLVEQAQQAGWTVLLDAAAFVPTSRLDLSAVRPEFVTLSFYKMFGYPTGIGCLIAKRASLRLLHRPWYAGGTVNFATVQGRYHLLSPDEAGFEDGTLNYLNIPAVEIGLDHMQRVGLDTITRRVMCLTRHLLTALLELRHSNGRPMVRIYGPATTEMRGGTVTLNGYDPDGHLLDYRRIEELAGERGISLRTGCFCNPGAGETAEGITESDMRAAADAGLGMTLPRFVQLMADRRTGKSIGAIRVSLGIVSTAADIERFLEFLGSLRDQPRLALGNVTFDIESCRVIRDGS
ncbi:MAG: aminotransferase class V-fold PLP-dependent enzyme [Acidobacteriaceae bacterium]|jgi:selenocysteine lyase/cysteine desulfurase|nr:aminotransferase class V-fold PLP-dependent enzyme [Acidobacteriaceae bacterium]